MKLTSTAVDFKQDNPPTRYRPDSWGWLPALSLLSALGVVVVAVAAGEGRAGGKWANQLFWLGTAVTFVPIATRLVVSSRATRHERLALLTVLNVMLYVARIVRYPLDFSTHDEFDHLRNAQDIAATGHLFQPNPLVPILPFYPGLEIVTTAISSLTGLSTFVAGLIVIGVARLLLGLALYLLVENATGSMQLAAVATALYMVNPHFLFFDAMFAYESLALPLAIFVLLMVSLRSRLASDGPTADLMLPLCLGLGAVVVTHHITSYFLVGFLFLWAAVASLKAHRLWSPGGPGGIALIGCAILAVWFVYTGAPIVAYLSPDINDTITQLFRVITGHSSARHLFQDTSGYVEPLAEQLIGFAAQGLIVLGLLLGLPHIWRRYRYDSFMLALGIGALMYPASQALRLSPYGTTLADRATEFVFVAVGCTLACAVLGYVGLVPRWRRSSILASISVAACLAILFWGGVIVGGGEDWEHLPGPYLVGADERSIGPEGMAAATWADSYLGPANRMATDRVNDLLMGSYGHQWVVMGEVAQIFTQAHFESAQSALIWFQHIRYLVVDQRLSAGLPRFAYFDGYDPQVSHYTSPISPAALTKFDSLSGVNRLYDSGNIVIYDLSGYDLDAS